MSKPRKKCIFCGGTGMSREHIWGDWLKPHVPRTVNKHRLQSVVVNRPGVPSTSSLHIRAGDPMGSNVRVVCKPCNNGWMSRLQNAVKPILLPLIRGERTVLGQRAQETLSAWTTMAVMTSEHIDPAAHMVAVSQSERDAFSQHQAAFPNWQIWIGRYQRHRWVGQWVHTAMPVLGTKDIPADKDAPVPPPNTQTTTIILGQLYILAISSEFADIPVKWGWAGVPTVPARLARISPPKESIIAWPPSSLTDQEAEALSHAFFDWIDGIGRANGF